MLETEPRRAGCGAGESRRGGFADPDSHSWATGQVRDRDKLSSFFKIE